MKGMTLHDMVRVASQLRLSTRALRAEMSNLHKLRLPCVLHWDHNHFVVLTRVGKRAVTIHDPALGARKIPLEEVSRRFTGIALEAWPAEGFERKTERARIRILDIVRRTEGFAAAAVQILLMSLFVEIIVIATPIGFQLVLDEVIVADDRNLLVLIALGLGLSCLPGGYGLHPLLGHHGRRCQAHLAVEDGPVRPLAAPASQLLRTAPCGRPGFALYLS
jgi:ATP-binding cassette subfamily B protein RaxB